MSAAAEPKTCLICGKPLIYSTSGDSPQWICPLHSTRGVPKRPRKSLP